MIHGLICGAFWMVVYALITNDDTLGMIAWVVMCGAIAAALARARRRKPRPSGRGGRQMRKLRRMYATRCFKHLLWEEDTCKKLAKIEAGAL